jgi:hypothetical protein
LLWLGLLWLDRTRRVRRRGRHAANPVGDDVPPVRLGAAVLAAREMLAGPGTPRLAGGIGDQVL